MVNRQKAKGDQAERDAAKIIHDLLGVPARRQLGAGRLDDVGDIDGIPNTVIQVAARKSLGQTFLNKPLEVEKQRANANADFAASFIKLPGGHWRVVMTPEQWATLMREVLS